MQTFSDKQKIIHTEKLDKLLTNYPSWVHDFFRGKSESTSVRTRISYAYDIGIFLDFLSKKIFNVPILEITLEQFSEVTVQDIEHYVSYLTVYTRDGVRHTNLEGGKFRKIASLKSFYNYYFKRKLIPDNPTFVIDRPKLKDDDEIIQLDANEVVHLLDGVEKGEFLKGRQRQFHKHTQKRDLALMSLLLGTGMRVSECMGVNENDLDFKENGVRIVRKGGKKTILYFNEEVAKALQEYMAEKRVLGHISDDDALFVSLHRKRMSVRAIQAMVRKYSDQNEHIDKKISAHKLRSTYGTNLYRELNDIYLVADALGHRDVNTTKNYYAKMDKERRKLAAKVTKLRID